MTRNYNSQYYSEEDDALAMIMYLLNENNKSKTFYNDIHVKKEDFDATIVEWAQVFYDGDDFEQGSFKFVDGNQQVMTEFIFPDNHIEMLGSESEFEERLKKFLEEDPDWAKNEYGRWYRVCEQTAWEENLKGAE